MVDLDGSKIWQFSRYQISNGVNYFMLFNSSLGMYVKDKKVNKNVTLYYVKDKK